MGVQDRGHLPKRHVSHAVESVWQLDGRRLKNLFQGISVLFIIKVKPLKASEAGCCKSCALWRLIWYNGLERRGEKENIWKFSVKIAQARRDKGLNLRVEKKEEYVWDCLEYPSSPICQFSLYVACLYFSFNSTPSSSPPSSRICSILNPFRCIQTLLCLTLSCGAIIYYDVWEIFSTAPEQK